jgi:hypothetical protein
MGHCHPKSHGVANVMTITTQGDTRPQFSPLHKSGLKIQDIDLRGIVQCTPLMDTSSHAAFYKRIVRLHLRAPLRPSDEAKFGRSILLL